MDPDTAPVSWLPVYAAADLPLARRALSPAKRGFWLSFGG
jgi:hypothetical protein